MSNLTKHQQEIKKTLSKLISDDQKILKKYTSNSIAISNLQYGGSVQDFTRQSTLDKLGKIVEKLEVNSEEEKCDILKKLIEKIDFGLETDSTMVKTVFMILQLAKKEFLHDDFELNLPDRKKKKEIYDFSDEESEESYHAFEEELSDWDASLESSENEMKNDDEIQNSPNFESQMEISESSSESSEFHIQSDFQLKIDQNKILVTEADISMNILSMLMSGGRGLSSLYTTGFQLFKHATHDNNSEIIALDFKTTSYQVSHITDGCLNSMLQKFTSYINLIKQVLTFCEKIRQNSNWACYRYVSEFCAILNDEYNLVHGQLVECYTSIQVNSSCRQANLLRLYVFVRKVMKRLFGLWNGAGKRAFLENSSLSHQQRYGLILNEIYLKEFQENIENDARLKIKTCDFYEVKKSSENHYFDEVLENMKNFEEEKMVEEKEVCARTVLANFSTSNNFLRMFSLCQTSIKQILHGTANPRVRPVMLDVHLSGHFWAAIASEMKIKCKMQVFSYTGLVAQR